MNPFKKNALLTVSTVLMLLSLSLTGMAYEWNTTESHTTNSSDVAVRLFEQGRELFEMGRTDDAVTHFNRAVQENAQYAVAWLYKALAAEKDADRNANIEKALLFRDNASEEEQILLDVMLTYADNNFEKRFQLAKRLAALSPEDARALLILAGEYQSRGETGKFRDLAQEAIRVDPESPLGYRTLAASCVLNEPMDLDLAEKSMKKFVEMRPWEASAHIALGDVYRASLNLEQAKAAYSDAIALDPQNFAAWSKSGYIHTYLGMFDEAQADFIKARALSSHRQDYAKPHAGIASYLFPGTGKVTANSTVYADRVQHNTKMVPMNGQTDNCYFCSTFISMFHGFIVSPVPSTNASYSIRYEFDMEAKVPDENTIEANIAFVQGMRAIQRDDYKEAKQLIRTYARTINPNIKPKMVEAHNFLAGLIHYRQGKYAKALACLKKSDTKNIFVKYNMGLTYDKLGMNKEAKEVLTEVARFNYANADHTQMKKFANHWLKTLAAANVE